MRSTQLIFILPVLVLINFNAIAGTKIKRDSSVSYLYNNLSESWQKSKVEVYEYNDANKKTKATCKKWNGFQCENEFQVSWTYDNKGRLICALMQLWDGEDWVNNYQIVWTFDRSGVQSSALNQDWNGREWVNNYLITCLYNKSGMITNDIYQYWNGQSWVRDALAEQKKYQMVYPVYLAQKN